MEKSEMKIQDYELTNNIDVLFEKKIIIYGAGKYGIRSVKLLEKAGVGGGIYCFCDRNAGQKQHLNYQVITPDELEVTVKKEDCMIVLGSKDYCDEMIGELARREVKAYICTWYGLQVAIEININDVRFLKAFQEEFKRKKELFSLLIPSYTRTALTEMCRISPSFLVYQSMKVGSSTVFTTLLRGGVDAVKIHNICFFNDADTEMTVMEEASAFFKKHLRAEGCKIITLVRDPVARELSLFMEGFITDMYTAYHFDNGCSLAAKASEVIVRRLDNNDEFTWFDRELKEATGIDIYQYPFDKEKGYAWIKEGNIEILVMTLEKLNENVGVLGDFVDKPGIKLQNANVGDEKQYKYIYEGLKKDIRIPVRVVESQYKNNPQLDHFYTEEEKKRFLQKWSRYVEEK